MVEPVTLRMTSRSSKARGLGTSAVVEYGELVRAQIFRGRGRIYCRTVLTDFDAILAHPDKGLHLFARGVCVLLTVASRVGHVLLGDSIVAMPEGFLNQICCLCHYSHVDGVGWGIVTFVESKTDVSNIVMSLVTRVFKSGHYVTTMSSVEVLLAITLVYNNANCLLRIPNVFASQVLLTDRAMEPKLCRMTTIN